MRGVGAGMSLEAARAGARATCPVLAALLAVSVCLATPPQRIVSTAPSITETLFALGLGDRVVGVSTYCHYPPEAAARAKVGTYLHPNVETIASLRPDLVIVQALPDRIAPQLARMKVNVLEVDHGDLQQTLASIRLIGERAGVPDRAGRLISDLQARLDAVRGRTANLPRRSLIFIVGRTPGRLEDLVAAGKASYLNELIEIAGGHNALAGTALPYAKISLETVIGLDPDVVIDMGDMADTTNVTEAHKREVVALWGKHAKQVYAVASDIFVVPGPRMVDAAEAFARMLHPEALR